MGIDDPDELCGVDEAPDAESPASRGDEERVLVREVGDGVVEDIWKIQRNKYTYASII